MIEDYHTEKKFDVILLLNIIEHVANPISVLQKTEKMLAPRGIVVIKTPNVDSLDANLFRRSYWGGLHCPRHWIIFSDKSFLKMVEQVKLSVVQISFTQGAPFWTYSILQLFRKKKVELKKTPLIDHPLFGVLSLLFAIFDTVRSMFSKTSQMFVVLKK